MSYPLDITKQAQSDIDFFRRTGKKAVLKKINTLLEELVEHPFSGTRKPEALKYSTIQLNHLFNLPFATFGK